MLELATLKNRSPSVSRSPGSITLLFLYLNTQLCSEGGLRLPADEADAFGRPAKAPRLIIDRFVLKIHKHDIGTNQFGAIDKIYELLLPSRKFKPKPIS